MRFVWTWTSPARSNFRHCFTYVDPGPTPSRFAAANVLNRLRSTVSEALARKRSVSDCSCKRWQLITWPSLSGLFIDLPIDILPTGVEVILRSFSCVESLWQVFSVHTSSQEPSHKHGTPSLMTHSTTLTPFVRRRDNCQVWEALYVHTGPPCAWRQLSTSFPVFRSPPRSPMRACHSTLPCRRRLVTGSHPHRHPGRIL